MKLTIYGVYDDNDNLIFSGTIAEVAEFLEYKNKASLYSAISHGYQKNVYNAGKIERKELEKWN